MSKSETLTSHTSIYLGDSLEELDKLQENSIDSIVTDPPYELNFMGKGWDNAGISFNTEIWSKCLRVLKPGGYLLAFGGSRTFHRIACAIEDAGFEIRDTIMWLYGSGFPKSMNLGKGIEAKLTTGSGNKTKFKNLEGTKVESGNWGISKMSKEQGFRPTDYTYDKHLRTDVLKPTTDLAKQWQGWGTCLKPAFEPIIVARKPFKGSLVDNVIKWGVGGINIDECRVESSKEDIDKLNKEWDREWNTNYKSYAENVGGSAGFDYSNARTENKGLSGRFPANLILTYEQMTFDEVCGGFPNTKGNENIRHNKNDDSGSASRYFYCAKASKKDRDEGLEGFAEQQTTDGCIRSNSETARKFGANSALRKNIHPTVKPTELMQYLVRLVTPKDGIVLDPFMGSGSTGKACMYENKEHNKNYRFIGIEKEKEYYEIAKQRIKNVDRLE